MSAVVQALPVTERARRNLARADVRVLCLLFLIAQALDAISTSAALETDAFVENNPVFAAWIAVSPLFASAMKLCLAAAAVVLALAVPVGPRSRRLLLIGLFLASLIAPATNGLRLMGVL